jgi:CRISPR-associated protein (TIGR03984 family)
MSEANTVSLTLHVLSTNSPKSLDDCIREFKSLAALSSENPAVGWAMSPDNCAAMRMTDSDVQQMPSDSSLQGKPFEVRLFTKDYDFRWLQVRPGLGQAAIVTERDVNESQLAALKNWKLVCHEQVEPIRDQNYLVWGKVLASVSDSAWATMTDARIGEIQVPVSNANKDQSVVVLKYVEYLQEADEDGNVVVFEERLCGFSPKFRT